jgi:hypothetical protein
LTGFEIEEVQIPRAVHGSHNSMSSSSVMQSTVFGRQSWSTAIINAGHLIIRRPQG